MSETYAAFFERVTKHKILPYQERFGQDPFASTLLAIPTGLGKTDSVVLPWLYAQTAPNLSAPTRLIIVLPRQNLTAQTADVARKHVAAANLEKRIAVLELMEGSEHNKEKLHPHAPTIIVSTQDLVFSRGLNRGYARSPYHWPIDFALYNQDCLIVLDELQLMDDALATSLQLAAFRDRFKTFGTAPSVWMSATVNPAWMQTVDFDKKLPLIELSPEDKSEPIVLQRIHAPKALKQASETCRAASGCAAFALERHKPGTRSLIIVNTVTRAREIHRALSKSTQNVVLLHSRFRPRDRAENYLKLKSMSEEGQIVVSTQVLEAGVDITSQMLITDLAPWSSLVQRFGRVNRYGEVSDAEIWWIHEPAPASAKQSSAAPYTPAEVERAFERIKPLTSAAPADLPGEHGPVPWQHVLREADLLDLFDTTPDLSGNEIDVSRFIRASEDRNVYLAWRTWEGAAPPEDSNDFEDGELCPVPLNEFREFLKKKHRAYVWNFATEQFSPIHPDKLFAGMRALTHTAEGGYTASEGWSPESKAVVEPLAPADEKMPKDSSDPASFPGYRQTLQRHTLRVSEELEKLLLHCKLDPELIDALRLAATKHDWGKAHHVFQETMHRCDVSPDLLAKQCGNNRHSRSHFRHELASALAMLSVGDPDLATYLVAAHHGRIRLGIRSMHGEDQSGPYRRVRGIQEGDRLESVELVPGQWTPEVNLSLAPVGLGAPGGSWTSRMLKVRDRLGPFRLAYLETLLRIADQTASAFENSGEPPCPQ